MIGQRILNSKSVRTLQHLHIDNAIQGSYNHSRLKKSHVPSKVKNLPFLWSPKTDNQSKTDTFIWHECNCNQWKDIQWFYNLQYEKGRRFDSLQKLLVLDVADRSPVVKKRCNFKSIESENVSLVPPSWTQDGDVSRKFEQSLHSSCVEKNVLKVKRTNSLHRRQRHCKALNFINTSKCFSKERQHSKAKKKLPGSNQLIIEKIATNITEEWPKLFSSKILVDPLIIAENILFENAVLGIKTSGSRLYRLQIWLFKWTAKLFWYDRSLQILQVSKGFEDRTIKIRWLVNGRSRIFFPMSLMGRPPTLRYMDFFSIMKVGASDKIEVHTLSKLVPRQTAQKRNILLSALTLLGLSRSDLPDFQEEPVLPSTSDPGS